MKFTKRSQQGFALILVLLIGALMMIPVLMLLSAVAPRRATVTGEALSDRTLTAADGMVDNVLNKINALPASLTALTNDSSSAVSNELKYISANVSDQTIAKKYAKYYVMGYLLAGINGGTISPNGSTGIPLQTTYDNYTAAKSSSGGIQSGSLWDIEDNVTTYLYNLASQQYYEVCTSAGAIAPVTKTGIGGDILTQPIKNLTTGEVKIAITGTTAIARWDPTFATDNQWIEIDANAQYIDDGTNGKVQIRTSAYLLSSSTAGSIVRNVVAEAPLKINAVWGGASGPASGPFRYALFSGNGFTNSSTLTVKSGHMLPDGSIQTDSGQGDVFVGPSLTNSSTMKVDGQVATSGTSASIKNSSTLSYTSLATNVTETVPDFQPGTETSVKTVAQAKTGGSSSAISIGTTTTITVDAGTGHTAYYTNGNVTLSGSGNTIKLSPLPNLGGSPVDWYINGDFTISAPTTIDFGSTPGIIWVNGNVTFSSVVTIKGSGTIVANKTVTCSSSLTATTGKLALISEATTGTGITFSSNAQVNGIFYAPHSDITISSTSTVFGSVVAGGKVTVSSPSTVTYDTSLSSGGSTIPPLPGPASVSVSFAARTTYRSSWKEAIGVPVTNLNIAKLNPTFTSGS